MEKYQKESLKFNNPEEEIGYLRARVIEAEKKYLERFDSVHRESVIRDEIKRYAKANPEDILPKGSRILDAHAKEIVLELAPETHDKKMEELLAILEKRGIKNALDVVGLMDNPHIVDDFHRFIVQYIKSGLPIIDESRETATIKALKKTLYEVSFSAKKQDEKEKVLKEMISSMEQFYAGMLSVSNYGRDSFSIEVANAEGSDESVFYVAVPDELKILFEKHILSIFPKARLFEKKDDYNIFNYDGVSVGFDGYIEGNPIFPIKTYDKFDYDPLHILLNAFAKIDRDGEGASLQIVMTPDSEGYLEHYKEALRSIEKGVPLYDAINVKHSIGGELLKTTKNFAKEALKDLFTPKFSEKEKDNKTLAEENKGAVEEIRNKISSPIFHSNIRIIASAKTRERAYHIGFEIASAFNQFENTFGSRIKFKEINGQSSETFFKSFVYRTIERKSSSPFSINELTTFMHFPQGDNVTPHMKVSKSSTASAPVGIPNSGTLLGINKDRNTDTNIYITEEDRLRHMYVIGQTGTGKTTLLKNMIAQDILAGNGVCMIDPHGTDIQDILSIIPKSRYEDLIYFDPGYTDRPMALNMLEYDPRFPEQKTFVVNELLSIFNKLFDMKVAGGPMFEQYFRNAVLLVMDDPETGNTLFDVSKVLSSKQFRELKLSKCKNPVVIQFWREIADKAGGEASLQNVVPYITSKFDVFLTNDIMRPIIAQEKSTFNFREIMDNKKILLVNLSKGRLGDINANLIGLIIVGKILMAALSRVDSFGKDFPPFYLFIDEFQNITTNSIAQILSEARKYRLSLTIAHQFIAQLEDDIKDAVFGNVGSISAFRVGADDAEYLEKQFEPVFNLNDLMNLDNRNTYIKLLANGKPMRPFSMETLPPYKGDLAIVDKLKELSYLKFGKDRLIVENQILNKYRKDPVPDPNVTNSTKSGFSV